MSSRTKCYELGVSEDSWKLLCTIREWQQLFLKRYTFEQDDLIDNLRFVRTLFQYPSISVIVGATEEKFAAMVVL